MSEMKTAIVTGANRGIGLETVRQLATRGICVIATVRALEHAGELEAMAADGLPVLIAVLDVSSAHSVKTFASHVYESVKTVDILINNAGVALDKWVTAMELDIDVWRQTMEVNLYGALRMCQAFVPGMKAAGYGRIVNVSSELGSLTDMQMGSSVAYRSSKTALNSMTKLLACELKEFPNILVNASCPGWVKTELGGEDAPLTPAQGADTSVWLATLPAGSGSGGLYRERDVWPW